MPITLNGTTGIAGVDGSAGTPAVQGGDSNTGIFFPAADTMAVATGGAERVRVESNGGLLIGNGSAPSSSNQGTRFRNLFNVGAHQFSQGAATTNTYIDWINANGTIGSIAANGSVVQYNTTSDYRLKENVSPMTGALAKIASLKPVTYTWKIDGSDGEGFIAHELAEVCPHAVSGAKDAVDAEGNPKYQGIDTSFLVATLVKAVQELKAEVDSLKAQLEAAQ
jgi:hypothetical protein